MDFESLWTDWRRRTMLDVVRAGMIWHLASIAGPGEFAELGVYDGGMCGILAEGFRERRVRAYDTFCGVPGKDIEEGSPLWEGRFSPLADTLSILQQFPNICLYEGRFREGCPGESLRARFALVHLDVDTYAGTLAGLKWFWPRLTGFLVIDDFRRKETPGVERAVCDFLPDWEECRYAFAPNLNQLILEHQ